MIETHRIDRITQSSESSQRAANIRQRTRFWILLAWLVPMACLTAWVFKHATLVPPYPGFWFPPNASLATWPDTGPIWRISEWPLGPTKVECVDLQSGRRKSLVATSDYLRLRSSQGIGYEIIAEKNHYVLISRNISDDSTKRVGKLESYFDARALVCDRYLIKLNSNQVVVLDTQQTTDGFIEPRAFPVPSVDLNTLPRNVPGTSIFLIGCMAGTRIAVKGFTLESGELVEVASWAVGGISPTALIADQHVLTVAASNTAIEISPHSNLGRVTSRPVRSEICAQWAEQLATQSTFTYRSDTSGQLETVRLPELTKINELDGMQLVLHNMACNTTYRWSLFSDETDLSTLTVYDSRLHQVVASLKLDYPRYAAAPINDHQVAVVDKRLGGTITVFDIPSQRVHAVYQPMLWPHIGELALCIMTIVWCIAWLVTSSQLRLPIWSDWLILSLVIFAPALFRMITFSMWHLPWRFSVQTVQAGIAASLLAMSCYLVYGRHRWPYRLIAWSALGAAITWGLMTIQIYVGSTTGFPGQAWLHFSTLGAMCLGATFLTGSSMRSAFAQTGRSGEPRNTRDDKRLRMIDWFAFTAGLAILLVAYTLSKQQLVHLKISLESIFRRDCLAILAISAQVLVNQLVATRLMLSPNLKLHRLGLCLGALACAMLIAEFTIVLLAPEFMSSWYTPMVALRQMALVYLFTAAWAWRLRP